MTKSEIDNDWLKLDNAAKVYPSTSTEKSPAAFRLQVSMKKPVNLFFLQKALKITIKRCPYYQVYLKRGFFWYYLQKHQAVPKIELLAPIPNFKIVSGRKAFHLLLVSIKKNIIAIDFSHIIADGSGAMRFFLTLIYEYLKLQGIKIERNENILNTAEPPEISEFEDAHRKYFQDGMPGPGNLSAAYHLNGRPLKNQKYSVITGILDLKKILDLAHLKNVTVTEYFTALYMYSLEQIRQTEIREKKKSERSIIRLEVPVNLRQFYQSATMRNFSLYVSPEIDLKLGDFSFEDILKIVHHSMQMQINGKELSRQISRNVGAELNPIIRSMPLFIKDQYLSFVYPWHFLRPGK